MLNALLEYSFIQNAFLGSILASIACGIIGTIIVEKKLVMMSGGIAHTSFGGIGLGYLLGVEPILGAFVFAVSAALGINIINKRSKTNTDVLMGIFWAAGMAAGILFISFAPGYPPDMSSYLFGDILTISRLDIWIMLSLDIIITFVVIAMFNHIKAYLFDEEFAEVIRIRVRLLETVIFILIALTIVILIRVVGVILVIALLTVSPAIAKFITYDFKKIIVLSILLGIVFCLSGLWVSYTLNIASGSSIILLAGLTYIIVSVRPKGILK